MKPLIYFNTLIVQFNMCTGSALVRIHSIQRVEDLMPALHATTLKYQLNKHYSYSSMLQGLNAYLFLGHFPDKKKLKISITFCPVDSVRHARIHNLCCQQFSIEGLVKLAYTTMHGPPSWNSGLTCVPFSSILSWLEIMVSWSVSSIYVSFYRFWGQ